MSHERVLLTLLSTTCLFAASCASTHPAPVQQEEPAARPAPAGRPARPSLGYVEHRGRQHEIRDLMDPAYRAQSDDDFARRFSPETALVVNRFDAVDDASIHAIHASREVPAPRIGPSMHAFGAER